MDRRRPGAARAILEGAAIGGGFRVCFSPEADVVAAAVIGAAGVDALRHVQRRAQWPLAALPILLAGHTFVEAFVWWSLRGSVGAPGQTVATAIYLGFAFVVLPMYVPVTVLALERVPAHRRYEIVSLVAGALCAVALAATLIDGPVTANADHHHIVYRVDLWAGIAVIVLYLLSTCGALLVSSLRFLRWFGAVNLAAVGLLAWFETDAVTSLWCAWAAVTSIAVAVHLRRQGDSRRSGARASAP
ncbi:DUF6629 family protein [Frankia sp. R43]|uniref:DUF6629 family protein n=1 Tax=Frankia sp. R43 TaxID=269536 RepID=UPI000B1B7AEA|nr:DUF6629 family protein [Frankia sp. R43]